MKRLLIGSVFLLAVLPQEARSAEFVVDTKRGDVPDAIPGDGNCLTAKGECSLAAAIEEANLASEGTTIVLPKIVHAKGLPEITTGLPVSISCGSLKGCRLQSRRAPLLRAALETDVQISDVEFKSGKAEEGGCLYTDGTLHLERVKVTRCIAEFGGGVLVGPDGSLFAEDCDFYGSRNIPTGFGRGGNIANYGHAEIRRSTLMRGQARKGSGGGFFNAPGATAIFENVVVTRNRARLGQFGGVRNEGTMSISFSNISHNQANSESGGLGNFGQMEIQNSILGLNFHVGDAMSEDNCFGVLPVSLGGNLEGGADSCGFSAEKDLSGLSRFELGLEGPQYNGGVIKTPEITQDSLARGNCVEPIISDDARGFPRASGPECASGAFQPQPGE